MRKMLSAGMAFAAVVAVSGAALAQCGDKISAQADQPIQTPKPVVTAETPILLPTTQPGG